MEETTGVQNMSRSKITQIPVSVNDKQRKTQLENDDLWWTAQKSVSSEDDLLKQIPLRKKDSAEKIRCLYVIGAHEFQEHQLLKQTFPNLEKIYLFEPIPQLFSKLQKITRPFNYIEVFPYAVSDFDGPTMFNVTDNLASSSLLHFGKHKEMFPHVNEIEAIPVQCRKLSTIIKEHQLIPPDMLFIDVQGTEYMVLSAIPVEILNNIIFIYTEASTAEVYKESRPLSDIRTLLDSNFIYLGFAPLTSKITEHGNALFINVSDALNVPPS
jgi:FkbM family methyltransferase